MKFSTTWVLQVQVWCILLLSLAINFHFSLDRSTRISLILQRGQSTKFSQNRHDISRKWSNEDLKSVLRAASEALPDLGRIIVFSDLNVELMECIPCQIRLFSMASYVIGVRALKFYLFLCFNFPL